MSFLLLGSHPFLGFLFYEALYRERINIKCHFNIFCLIKLLSFSLLACRSEPPSPLLVCKRKSYWLYCGLLRSEGFYLHFNRYRTSRWQWLLLSLKFPWLQLYQGNLSEVCRTDFCNYILDMYSLGWGLHSVPAHWTTFFFSWCFKINKHLLWWNSPHLFFSFFL